MSKHSSPNIFYNSFKSSDSILSPFEHKEYTINTATKKSFMDTVFNRKKLSKSDIFKFHGINLKRKRKIIYFILIKKN